MIKSLSPYYITTPWISPLTGAVSTSYTLEVFVWNGGKGNSGSIPVYSLTKENLENSSLSDKINIARLVNDYIYFNPISQASTGNYSGDNQLWVKTQVKYTSVEAADLDATQNIDVQLLLKGYGYGMEGENPQPPTDKVFMQGREFNVNRDGVFNVPILIDEEVSDIFANLDSYDLLDTTQYIDVMSNDTLGIEPTTITSVTHNLDSSYGSFNNLGNLIEYVSNGIVVGAGLPVLLHYTITDSIGASSTVLAVYITISERPETVEAIDDFYELDNETVVVLDVMANDLLGQPPTTITAFNDASLTSGSITNNTNNLTFTPNGVIPLVSETFTYTISDTVGSSQGTVTLRVRSDDGVYITTVANIGNVTGNVSGQYTNGVPFSFDIPPLDGININACVIESSIVTDDNIIPVVDLNINC